MKSDIALHRSKKSIFSTFFLPNFYIVAINDLDPETGGFLITVSHDYFIPPPNIKRLWVWLHLNPVHILRNFHCGGNLKKGTFSEKKGTFKKKMGF